MQLFNIGLLQLATMIMLSNITLAKSSESIETVTLELEKGQILSLVSPVAKENGEQYRQEYYDKAFPLGEQFGLQNMGRLHSVQTIIGNHKPAIWAFYSWPNAQKMQAFEKDTSWAPIKALRPLGWEELKIASIEMPEDKTVTFRADKYYTLAFAWLDPENPDDYFTYLKNIEPILPKVGGKFVLKMKKPNYEVHASQPLAPGQITFVEWDSIDGLQQLQANEEYQAQLDLLRRGTSGFELHILQVNK
jgi:uncharacterized protein (DUF1330 family)